MIFILTLKRKDNFELKTHKKYNRDLESVVFFYHIHYIKKLSNKFNLRRSRYIYFCMRFVCYPKIFDCAFKMQMRIFGHFRSCGVPDLTDDRTAQNIITDSNAV